MIEYAYPTCRYCGNQTMHDNRVCGPCRTVLAQRPDLSTPSDA